MTNNLPELYHDFDNIKPIILKGFPELSDNLEKIKPYLFSRLISQYFEKNEFEKVISHITSFEGFYEEPELLKNVGIACLRMANNQQITIHNYQNIISTWFTAVYSDEVILNSLETTDWDDEYTFTLVDSIGSEYMFENDVENVNFEDVSNDNISIGDIQRQLVTFFESALNEISDNALSEKVQSFYQSEKEAIEKIIAVISTQIIYAAPYFSKQHNLDKGILNHLVSKFRGNQDMSLLRIGNLYVKNTKPAIFRDFAVAEKMIKDCVVAIRNLDSTTLKKQNTTENKKALQAFPKLQTQLEHEILSAFNQIIERDDENIDVIYVFESAIPLVANAMELKTKNANFITNLAISKVNDGDMKNKQALVYLIKAYELNTTNHRTVNNLSVIAKFNCMDMLNGISDTARTHLEQLVKIKNGLLTQSLRNELSETFYGLMEQIRQNDDELVKLFEKEILGSKNSNPFDTPDSLNLYAPSLNAEGLKLAKKLKLIYQLIKD
jgi:hypothetical protein